MLFEKRAAGKHHLTALRNAIHIFSLILVIRGSEEQRRLCFDDMHIIVVNGHQFVTLNGKRVSKSRQREDIRDIRHGVGVLAALPSVPDKCPVTLFLEYSSKRQSAKKHSDIPMFLVTKRMAPKDVRKNIIILMLFKRFML